MAKTPAACLRAWWGLRQSLPLKPGTFLNLLAPAGATVAGQSGPWRGDGGLGGVVVAGGADRDGGQRRIQGGPPRGGGVAAATGCRGGGEGGEGRGGVLITRAHRHGSWAGWGRQQVPPPSVNHGGERGEGGVGDGMATGGLLGVGGRWLRVVHD